MRLGDVQRSRAGRYLSAIRYLAPAIAVLASVAVVSTPGSAQELRLAKPIEEVLSNRVPVSGNVIVGVALRAPSGPFDPNRMFLVPAPAAGDRLCLRVTTRDGRYWSLNAYAPAELAQSMLRLEHPTRFAGQLRVYATEDVAVRAILADQCREDSAGTLLPIAFEMRTRATELVVLVNAGRSRAQARLGTAGDWTECEPAAGQRVAFTSVCRLPLGSRRGHDTLHVKLVGLTGARELPGYPIELGQR